MTQMHLNKSGTGMASRTACGRNILRTPMSTKFADFKSEAAKYQCAKCLASNYFLFMVRNEAQKTDAALIAPISQADIDQWEPEASNAWKKQDDALFALRR